jgi:hypothetical protein
VDIFYTFIANIGIGNQERKVVAEDHQAAELGAAADQFESEVGKSPGYRRPDQNRDRIIKMTKLMPAMG